MQPLVLWREEGKEGEGQGPGPGERSCRHTGTHPPIQLPLTQTLSFLSYHTHPVILFFFNHLEDKVDYNYQGNNNFINGSQVPCLDCKAYLTCQTLTQLNVIGSNMDGPSDYHTKSSKSDKKRHTWYHSYVESKKWYKWTYLQNRNRLIRPEK